MSKEIIKSWQLQEKVWEYWQKHNALPITDAGVVVSMALPEHILPIVKLVGGQPALVGVSDEGKAIKTITGFVERGDGLVSINQGGEVVAFQGLGLWPSIKMCELRSAVTNHNYSSRGINTIMKKLMLMIAHSKYHGWQFVGFTEVASQSRGILDKLGFEETPMISIRQNLPILGDACPPQVEMPDGPNGCFLRCYGSCGCKVYLLNPLK